MRGRLPALKTANNQTMRSYTLTEPSTLFVQGLEVSDASTSNVFLTTFTMAPGGALSYSLLAP